ncbi:BrnA antitoxin of type II toxin-antitoxin system [Neolewinella xylanilytica]|uniref:BrnA antitoxin of type II toxin-antitoxin system n=1 Tax=Neolewinella xylanilytica TaxID=1514080 RepID=A0A2S6HZQ5_9BACT|nr:BrnA antitoxin family protein [Neolewinella xylanilytica]PPK83915.1 BrnA antitoxin of type II toxin-antitoxin system [Neolewinella xylanilytica]
MKIIAPTDEEDRQINEGIKNDPDTLEWSDSMFQRAVRGPQKLPTKEKLTVRLDPDIVEWFKAQGAGYQSRMNDALRQHITERS